MSLASVLRAVALAAMLLVAQTFAVVHPLDLAAHSNGEPCKICVSVASVGTATVSQPVVFAIDAASPALCRRAPCTHPFAPPEMKEPLMNFATLLRRAALGGLGVLGTLQDLAPLPGRNYVLGVRSKF